jgi:hypothetical protein
MSDKDLSIRGKNEVSQDEIERIWRATEWMSAQTPLEIRQAMLILKENGIPISVTEQMLLTVMTDIRAALTKDESKFAHLVAGTESIVSTLQTVNPLKVKLDKVSQDNAMLRDQVDGLEAKLDLVLEKLGVHDGESKLIVVEPEGGESDGGESNQDIAEHRVSSPEQLEVAQEKYDARIGSAWAKQPDQGPLYAFVCNTVDVRPLGNGASEKLPCKYIYQTGRLRPDDPAEDFRCPLHDTPLSFVGEAPLNDPRQFRKKIREKF